MALDNNLMGKGAERERANIELISETDYKRGSHSYPSGLCVGTAQTEKEGVAMRRLVLVLRVALAFVLLSVSNVR